MLFNTRLVVKKKNGFQTFLYYTDRMIAEAITVCLTTDTLNTA